MVEYVCDHCKNIFEKPKIITIKRTDRFGMEYIHNDTGCPKCDYPHFEVRSSSN